MKYLIGALLLILTTTTAADEIVHGFKNPSFSGIGTSAHYLTIENQEKSRRDQIQDDIESALKAAQREAENTTLAKFIRNLESRIFAQLSKQLVDNMFGNDEASMFGSFTLEGNTITYQRTESTMVQELNQLDNALSAPPTPPSKPKYKSTSARKR